MSNRTSTSYLQNLFLNFHIFSSFLSFKCFAFPHPNSNPHMLDELTLHYVDTITLSHALVISLLDNYNGTVPLLAIIPPPNSQFMLYNAGRNLFKIKI